MTRPATTTSRRRGVRMLLVLVVVTTAGCATYYDPTDPYIRGMRFFDRREFALAKAHWEPLAQRGDCDAEYRLGTLYFLGAGVPKEYQAAHEWWLRAANKGQAFAQALLATMYAHDVMSVETVAMTAWYNCERGCGYEKDTAVAYRWMRLAERYTPYEDGRATARRKADAYQHALTPEQRVAEDRAVRDWRPTLGQCTQRKIN